MIFYHHKMSPFFCLCCLLWITLFFQDTDAVAWFTQVPPRKLYVVKGQIAKLVWSYHVDNRSKEFWTLSPQWFYLDDNVKYIVGWDNEHNGWKFQILNTGPARLLSPTIRVSRGNQATLVIKHVITADSGIYGCTLALRNGNDITTITNTTELVVTELPRFTSKPNTITTIIEHSVLSIPCTAVGHPSPIVTWLNPVTNTTIVQGIGSSVLRISNVNRSQNGKKYKCQASNNPNEHPVSISTTVVVYYPAKITWRTIYDTVNQGHDINLLCQATANPPVSISWQREHNVAIKSGFTLFGNGTINIPNANRSDAGGYICTAKNVFNSRVNTEIGHAYLSVEYPPEFTSIPINTTVNQGHDITLHCQATARPPIISIYWKREKNVAIKAGFTLFGNGTLMIPNADTLDVGKYICIAKSGYPYKLHTAARSAYVSVKFPPGLPQLTLTNTEASSATLSWIKPLYNGGSPIIGYKLILDSKKVELSKGETEYTVCDLTKDTQYVVRVYARNDVGYSNATSVNFKTKKQGPPAQPFVTEAIVNQTSVTLAWTKPEENGGAITGYKIYKKVDGHSWTQVVQIYGTPLTYTVKNLEPGKIYHFIVTATNKFGESVKDDSKAKIVVIPDVTTKVPDSGRTTASTIKQLECKGSSSKSSAQKDLQGAMIGVCVCLLVISLVFNILSVAYFYRVKKKTKRTTEPTYNNVEMATAAAPSPSYVNVGLTSQPSDGFEPVRHANTIPSTENSTYEIPGNQQTSEDHYQQLNPETMQHDPTAQYEALRRQHVTTDHYRST